MVLREEMEGFLSAGYSVPITKLEQRLGKKYAQELYKLSVKGVDIVRQRSQVFADKYRG